MNSVFRKGTSGAAAWRTPAVLWEHPCQISLLICSPVKRLILGTKSSELCLGDASNGGLRVP